MIQSQSPSLEMTQIVIVVSAPMTITSFMRDHISRLARNHEVIVICNLKDSAKLNLGSSPNVRVMHVSIPRNPQVIQDFAALIRLVFVFLSLSPTVVQTVTPKAGLLGMCAAWISRVPVRVHWFTGQIWADSQGFKKYVLRFLDKCIVYFSTYILVDGKPQKRFLLEEGVLSPGSGDVLGEGSITGVDGDRFRSNPVARRRIRTELGLSETDFVVCFAGRLRQRKGFNDLLEAMRLLPHSMSAKLLAVGEDEESLRHLAAQMLNESFIYVRHTEEMQDYLASADILVLPSYREGFGQTVLEASACELPVVTSDIYGLADAVIPGVTGLTVCVSDPRGIAQAIEYLHQDPGKRASMGAAGRQRVTEFFAQETLVHAYVTRIDDLIGAAQVKKASK